MKSDDKLRSDILAELSWEPAVNASDVGVTVHGGVVTLTGRLSSHAEKFATERAVLRVAGVRGLAVDLHVKLPAGDERSDEDIAEAMQHALHWNALVPEDKVRAMVEKGHVTLTGEVAWDYQRSAAEAAVRNLLGVVAVTNLIHLTPRPTTDSIEKNIREALARQAAREARHVEVTVQGMKVTLSGKVHSWAERDAVMGAAWASPGVVMVVSDLEVEA